MKRRSLEWMRGVIAMLGSMAMVSCLAEPVTPAWQIPEDLKVADIGGYPMAYQDVGSGEPVLFVHGSMTDYRYWRSQVEEFSKRYRVIAVSLRHFYPERWDGNGGDFSVEIHAEDVAALIGHLGLQTVHLVGHSRGGAVALYLAHTHPERVRTLMLMDASGAESLLPDTPEGRRMAAETARLVVNLRADYAAHGAEYAGERFIDSLGGSGTWKKRTPFQRQQTIDNMGTMLGDPGTRPTISCADVRKLEFPVLFLTGARSPGRYGQMIAALRQCNPTLGEPVVVPDAAHSMNRDNVPFFNTVLDAHLSGR